MKSLEASFPFFSLHLFLKNELKSNILSNRLLFFFYFFLLFFLINSDRQIFRCGGGKKNSFFFADGNLNLKIKNYNLLQRCFFPLFFSLFSLQRWRTELVAINNIFRFLCIIIYIPLHLSLSLSLYSLSLFISLSHPFFFFSIPLDEYDFLFKIVLIGDSGVIISKEK